LVATQIKPQAASGKFLTSVKSSNGHSAIALDG